MEHMKEIEQTYENKNVHPSILNHTNYITPNRNHVHMTNFGDHSGYID